MSDEFFSILLFIHNAVKPLPKKLLLQRLPDHKQFLAVANLHKIASYILLKQIFINFVLTSKQNHFCLY